MLVIVHVGLAQQRRHPPVSVDSALLVLTDDASEVPSCFRLARTNSVALLVIVEDALEVHFCLHRQVYETKLTLSLGMSPRTTAATTG